MRVFPCLSITLLAIGHPLAIRAQDPVIKPIAGARGGRLPAPKTVTATQESDGRIRVVWNAVTGATSYRIVRSVPPAPMAALTPNRTDTVFFDSDVNAGSTYYYQIAAVDEGGLLGLNKAASAPVKAVRSTTNAGGNEGEPVTPRPPTNVVATMRQESRDVETTWDYGGRNGLYFLIEVTGVTTAPAVWSVYDRIGPSRPGVNYGHDNLLVDTKPEGTQFKFRVSAIDSATGARSTPTESNVVTVAHGSASCTTSNSDATAGSGGGAIVAHTGKTVSLRVGGVIPTSTVIAAPAQWISFDPHIATVDANGIKGISAGCAQMIASSRWGGINVYLVVVTVQP
jgi:hypothetical protein